MDPLSIGRRRYKEKDYKGALEAFTEGIKISSHHIRLTALDHRAATFEKLDQLQAALRDAKEMIEMKPGLAKGYLRCAKILQLKGKESLALEIYERGLKKVKVGDDPDRPVLQEMYNKLLKNQVPTKILDPLVMLPAELAQMVCQYLDIRDRVICLAVSRPWKRFLEASHDLWKVLDVRSARRPVSQGSLRAYLRRSNYGLNRVFLAVNQQVFNAKYLEILTRSCKQLSYMEIDSMGPLGDSLLAALPHAQNLRSLIVKRSELTVSAVAKALGCCPHLQMADFCNARVIRGDNWTIWPQLDSLESLGIGILGYTGSATLNLDQLIHSTPKLRRAKLILQLGMSSLSLTIPDFSQWSKLEHLEYYGDSMPLPTFPETLKYLDLSKISWPGPPQLPESITTTTMPLLETFMCNGTYLPMERILDIIGPSIKAGNLKKLSINDFLQGPSCLDNRNAPAKIPSDLSLPSVEVLSLKGCHEPENEILPFLRRFPALRSVDLSHTRVTGVVIKELMTREAGPLEWLGVNGCRDLSPDAVEYARSLGTVVGYNQDPAKKSARSRYYRDRQL